MKSLCSLAALALIPISIAFSSQPEKFSQVKIFVQDVQALQRVFSTGIDHEGVEGKIGGWMKFVAGDFELRELHRVGVNYQIEIEDMAKFYEQRLAQGTTSPHAFGYGSMGGFYTFAEVLQQLDSLRLLFPNIVTQRDSVGPSAQGRALWMTKIGSAQSAGKPEVLYTALHHAREPQGMMTVLYYMWWLCQNYGTNPEATYLVNNRQMYFIPVVNPDGYEYNRQIQPTGGGMWRKNRRNNLDGSFGVDPNRNYGPFYMWNAPNGGSSTSTSSDTYRGPSEFSEPENATIDRFMRAHTIKTCFNYHTYSNLLIYPWGYLSRESSDSLIYRDWAYEMTSINRYTSGTDLQTVNYSTRGNSDDYMFGDTTKPQTWTMTPEVGATGFWPSQSEIFPLAIENLQQNKLLAYFAGHYTTVTSSSVGGSGFFRRGQPFSLNMVLKNRGASAGAGISIAVTSNSPSLPSFAVSPPTIDLPPFSTSTLVVNGIVSSNATEGVPVQIYVRVSDAQGFEKIDTLKYFIGTPTVMFADSASAGTSNWTTGTGWGTTSNNHTPPSAFTDSPTGNYASSANNSLTLINQLNLTGYNFAELKFWTKWAIEPTWDFATVEASTNNGGTWTTLRIPLSHKGSARSGSQQPLNSWGFDSYTPGGTWVEQSADLSAYVNQQLKIRFRVAADGGDQRDGFYVDDIRVHGHTTSTAPLDTGIVVRRSSFTFNGNIGRLWIDSTIVKNATSSSVAISIAESSLTTSSSLDKLVGNGKPIDAHSIIAKLKPAVRRENFSALSIQGGGDARDNPNTYATILTDGRGENGTGAADIYRVQYQFRTSALGSFHDFRFTLGSLPDTNVAIILSIDTDQEFRTGRYPTPLGVGPTSRDVGSEREILIDASGILIDSLTGLGRIRAGVVLDVSQDSIRVVGLPFLLSIQRDSVLTIGTETITGGINVNALNDPDRKMNLGFMGIRLSRTNPLPDYAPVIGHANVGGETGVSWLTEDRMSFTLAANESTYFRIGALGAKPAGTHRAQFSLRSTGRQPVTIPITMNLTTPPNPIITVTPTTIRDTLSLGDSVTNTLTIRNTGGGALNYVVLDTAGTSWITINPVIGSVDSGLTATISIKVKSLGLRIDTTYAVLLAVISNDPVRSAIPVTLTLRVRRTTGVASGSEIPATFALHQNYPNPFNPETHISFDLPKSSFVTLKVFNLIGQEVGTIVNLQLDAGTHSYTVSTDRFGLSSGVYLYKIVARQTGGAQAGDPSTGSALSFVQTRKMILMR